ncbi:hypothetical protein [Methylobacterium sp. DCY52]|uniref:hypothetical protein n=1 Tax=Methylobacterium sp. DCY52 TaxID=739139 RepID=UPI003144EB8A
MAAGLDDSVQAIDDIHRTASEADRGERLPQQRAGRLAHEHGSARVQGDDLEILQSSVGITHGDKREHPLFGRLIDLFDQARSALGLADIDERDRKAPMRPQGQRQDLVNLDDAVLDPAGSLLLWLTGLEGTMHDLAQEPSAVASLRFGRIDRRSMQPRRDVCGHAHDREIVPIESYDRRAVGEAAERAEGDVLVRRQGHARLPSGAPTLAQNTRRVCGCFRGSMLGLDRHAGMSKITKVTSCL